jgi:gas vesicle protein
MEKHDEMDLLTAAVLGAVVGAGVALMIGRGGRRKKTLRTRMSTAAGRGAKRARGWGRRGAKWASSASDDLADRIPVDAVRKQVAEYFDTVKDAIDDTVSAELSDLRKSIRRQRKKIGV